MRVYRLSSRIWYTILIYALSLIRLGIAFALFVLGLPLSIQDYINKYERLIIVNACLADAIDVGNTIAMCYWLLKAQKEVTIQRYVPGCMCSMVRSTNRACLKGVGVLLTS